jgi:uncharacterized membrane protein
MTAVPLSRILLIGAPLLSALCLAAQSPTYSLHVLGPAETSFAVAWANGGIKKLGTVPGRHVNAAAYAVNNLGMIVGKTSYATLWSHLDAPPQDLSKLIGDAAAAEFTLKEATGINDHCAIVLNGENNETHADAALLLTLNDPSSCVNERQ